MKKPVIWININGAGQINETSDTHPASPPVLGGVWTVYAPANANLAEVLARNVELEAERDDLQRRVNDAAEIIRNVSRHNLSSRDTHNARLWLRHEVKNDEPISTQVKRSLDKHEAQAMHDALRASCTPIPTQEGE